MFDSSTQITMNMNDSLVHFDEEMDWSYNMLNFPSSEFYTDQFDFGIEDEEQLSPQSQIRNHDCMWSGRCTTHPNECLNSRNNCKKFSNDKAATQNQPQPTQAKPNTASTQKIVQVKKQQTIPAGQSLLRFKQNKPTVFRVPNIPTNDFINNREFVPRPDTPLSLDDDQVPEFKHNIDLAACTVGSNSMSLIHHEHSSPTEIINILREHLEDSNSNRTPPIVTRIPEDLDEIINDMKSFSDFENESDDDSESDATNDSFNNSIVSNQQSPAIVKPSAYDIKQSMHSDHSYTRSKGRVDIAGLGVQTPSDSGIYQFKSLFNQFNLWLFSADVTNAISIVTRWQRADE